MEREKIILVTANRVLASWCLHELQAEFDLIVTTPEDCGALCRSQRDAVFVLLDCLCWHDDLCRAIHFHKRFPVILLVDGDNHHVEWGECFNIMSPAHSLSAYLCEKRHSKYGDVFASMERFESEIRLAASTEENVLLLGESGSGKTWTAKRIHALSARARQKFFRVSAADLNPGLVESTLFGTTSGAYTGAVAQQGYFEAANGGTLFIDEIGELPYDIQGKLLNVLETRTCRRLGSPREYSFDARLIFATNKNLEQSVLEHRFRLDLFYRINSLAICVPALRQHPDDIPLLAAKLAGAKGKTLSNSAIEKLRKYSWPGNIRELENVITRSCIFSSAGIISAADIRFSCFV